ncbi:MAG: hypothetical protein NW241_08805 [Bacteroidia bacterium]|nr:hypothetical protein [Bacteroidia bacterium]
MARRKLTRIEKIILIGFISSAVLFVGYWLYSKKPNRDFYLPRTYAGWVKIRYNVPGAPPLPEREGVQQLVIPDSGFLETSTRLEVGWRRDRFFWQDGTPIPPYEDIGGQPHLRIYQHLFLARTHERELASLPVGTDTTLPDGTRIHKRTAQNVDYTPGRKTLEYFYLDTLLRPYTFLPPPLADPEALMSTDDREVPGQPN